MIGCLLPNSTSKIVIHSDESLPLFSYTFLIHNAENVCQHIKAKGHKLAREPFKVRYGKFTILLDEDGNELQIIDLIKFGYTSRYNQLRDAD